MNRLLLFLILSVVVGCRSYSEKESYSSPKKLDKISLKGKFYNGKELETKLNKIIVNSALDTFIKKGIYDRMEFYIEKYNPATDELGLTQNPSNFLFLDINEDNTEDLIFQSNGPFITDSHVFLIFLSNKENKYKLVREFGQIIDMQIIDEFCCATDSKKNKYLKVDYFNYGCCDNPWDQYKTGILNLGPGLFSDEFYTISLKAINRTAERELKNESK